MAHKTHRSRRHQSAFTLIEVLVASGVSLLLGLVIAAIMIQSTRSLAQTEGRVELVQAARIAANRLQLVVSSGAYIPGESAVLYPEPFRSNLRNEREAIVVSDEPDTWFRYMVLTTTEDSLAENFDPDGIYNLHPDDPETQTRLKGYWDESQTIFYYLIWWEDISNGGLDILPDEDKVLVIGRVAPSYTALELTKPPNERVPSFRDREWAGGADFPSSNPFADLSKDSDGKLRTRILARHLEDVSFIKRDDAGIQVSVLARKAMISQSGQETKEFRLESLLQIPAEIAI